MTTTVQGLKVKVRGQGQSSKVKVKVEMQLYYTSIAPYNYAVKSGGMEV